MSANPDFAIDAGAQDVLFREARTANKFLADPVTDAQIEQIYELFKWAPTSANTQPLRITIVRTPEAKARLLPHIGDGNRAKSASAPAIALLTADQEFHEHIPRLFPHAPQVKDGFADPAVREPFSKFNATLQAGYFILAARAAGLTAGPMLGFDAAGVDGEFFADTAQRTILVVNLGYPAEGAWFGRLPRLDYEEVVTLV